MTLEDFARLLIQKGKFDLTIDVLSMSTGNHKTDKDLPLTVIFKDKQGVEIQRVMVKK